MTKNIIFGDDARKEIQKGINKLANAVKVTMGAQGRYVTISNKFGINQATKDGVTVAKAVAGSLSKPFQNAGSKMVSEVCVKVAEEAGDGDQPLYSRIYTPNGYVQMKDLKIGDVICGTNGTTQKVMGIYPKGRKQIFKIKFFDGREAECSSGHLWEIINKNGKKEIIKTSDLYDKGVKTKGRHNFYSPITKIEHSVKDLPIDPYLLGVLLGDGSLSGTGDIEISLGKKKKHILDKIILPIGFSLKTKYVDSKNYYRVKIKGTSCDGLTFKNILSEIGLLGSKSNTKFIPQDYLFSTIKDRELLLQGLLDTDGYINKRGLFEYSTISDKLTDNFVSLCRSLGKTVRVRKKIRTVNDGSYSNNSINLITEMKGFKYGNKIISITKEDSFTEMQCIKVTNDDSLYITDNYVTTHNTTTSAVLTQAIYNSGLNAIKNGANPVLLKKGINLAVEEVVKYLKDSAEEVTIETIKDIATISANNDEEIGSLIADAVKQIGMNAIITPEKSKANKTYVEVIEGLEFESGYLSHYFVTNPDKMVVEHKSPAIYIYEGTINSIHQIMPMLEYVQPNGFPLVLIANDIHGEVLNLLALNKTKGNFPVVVIRAPYYGDTRREFLEDIALTTGATIVSSELQKFNPDMLGGCDKIVVKKDNTIIMAGHGDKNVIQDRVDSLKKRIENDKEIKNKKFLQERISKLSGGVAMVYVGGNTELEMKERFDRVEDALLAVRSAVSEGIVAGGGIAFVNANLTFNEDDDDVNLGKTIVSEAIIEPFKQILKNAAQDPDIIYEALTHTGQGYDVKIGNVVDMKEAGIIDPVKVLRVALESAASIASILLTTECSVIN